MFFPKAHLEKNIRQTQTEGTPQSVWPALFTIAEVMNNKKKTKKLSHTGRDSMSNYDVVFWIDSQTEKDISEKTRETQLKPVA